QLVVSNVDPSDRPGIASITTETTVESSTFFESSENDLKSKSVPSLKNPGVSPQKPSARTRSNDRLVIAPKGKAAVIVEKAVKDDEEKGEETDVGAAKEQNESSDDFTPASNDPVQPEESPFAVDARDFVEPIIADQVEADLTAPSLGPNF